MSSSIPRALQIDDEVVAKFHEYRDQEDGPDNPWFSGTVSGTDEEKGTCTVKFCDGDVSVGLFAEEVLYCPGRGEGWGKGDKRGEEPENAEEVRIGKVQIFIDDEVVAKFSGYRGKKEEDIW